jgi:hypothetical protein
MLDILRGVIIGASQQKGGVAVSEFCNIASRSRHFLKSSAMAICKPCYFESAGTLHVWEGTLGAQLDAKQEEDICGDEEYARGCSSPGEAGTIAEVAS